LCAGGTEWRLVLTESCRGFETESEDATLGHCVNGVHACGDGIGIDRTCRRAAPEMTCHSDTILGTGYPPLNYGQSRSFNSMTCESQEAGITRTDNSGGHYFRLARDNYELH
jgi:hypothetical protein